MSNEKESLTGRWLFIGKEEYVNSKWIESGQFVKGMMWDFSPNYIAEDKTVGNITETAPNVEPETLAYAYVNCYNILKLDIVTCCSMAQDDVSQADLYHVLWDDEGDVIRISLLTEFGQPLPYFRYVLKCIK